MVETGQAIIDEQGHRLYFEDTGEPSNGGIYTTLVLVHGTAFHSGIFKRLLPFANKYNFRIVLVNRRAYPGSSPYTEEELKLISGTDVESHSKFFKARGLECALFLKWLIINKNIPRAEDDHKRGGISLIAWSAGNAYAMPLLSFADQLDDELRKIIEPYFRSFVMYDLPRWVAGCKLEDDSKVNFFIDQNVSYSEKMRMFYQLIGNYYNHPDVHGRDPSKLEFESTHGRPGTLQQMSDDDLKEIADFVVGEQSELTPISAGPDALRKRVRDAFFNERLAKIFPKVEVTLIWCENTTWTMILAYWALSEMKEKAEKEGVKGRPLEIVCMPEANHFYHWDEPEKTLEFFSRVVDIPRLEKSMEASCQC